MIFPKLYKYTSKGQQQSWQIFTSGNLYWTEEGIHILTKSEPTVCTGKNIGRSNETTDVQQAILEATAKFQKKLDKGYNEVLTTDKKFFEPMLAFELKQYEKLLFTVPTFVQPKLDGVRCILKDGKLTTRAGKSIISCPHLEIDAFFFDGELYCNELKNNFNKIISLVRKTKPNQEDLEESKNLIQYWAYDNPAFEGTFSQRYARLARQLDVNFERSELGKYIKLVPVYEVKSMEEINKYHAQFLEEGYEGTMIRMDLGRYENKRSKQLLKYKNFQDAEFLILDVKTGSGNRANVANVLTVQLPDNTTCDVTMTGTMEFMAQVLKDKNEVIGKYATVKYFSMTEDNKLRFPTLKNIINYESK